MRKILVINGPNLGLLGQREKNIYGTITLEAINEKIKVLASELNIVVEFFQSNHEGELVDRIGSLSDEFIGAIINPAAYTHTSVAIRDAIAASKVPFVEVHISNIYSREEFRHKSLTAAVCKGQISGFAQDSYLLALRALDSLTKIK